MRKSRLTIIFIIVFIDILGFSLILPLLPTYAETYGATEEPAPKVEALPTT